MVRLAAAAAMTIALAWPAAAGPVELLFETPHLAALAPGERLVYAHRRASDPALELGEDFAERIALEAAPGAPTLTLDAGGARERRLPAFEGTPGNPLLTLFLERTARAVAEATGGSPFYIRNRMKEGLRDRLAEGPDGALVMRPFESDRNADRLGPFVALEMRFDVAPEAPGMIRALVASAPGRDGGPAFLEEMRLDPAP